MKRLLITLVIPLFLVACGSDDDAPTAEDGPIVLDFGDAYEATLEIGKITDASADIQITITAKDASSTEGEIVGLTPNMAMIAGHDHSTPMAAESGELDANGQFNTKAYFLMPTHSANGEIQGNWSFEVTFNDESVLVPFEVHMNTADRKMLRGVADQISGMSGPMSRPYFLYSEGRHVMNEMDSFTVYIAAREYMTKHTSLVDGITLVGTMPSMDGEMHAMAAPAEMDAYTLSNINVSVAMCAQDCDISVSWKAASPVNGKAGQYKASELGLTGDVSDIVKVRLTVNSEIKTTTGVETGTSYATFDFSNSSDSSDMMHAGH